MITPASVQQAVGQLAALLPMLQHLVAFIYDAKAENDEFASQSRWIKTQADAIARKDAEIARLQAENSELSRGAQQALLQVQDCVTRLGASNQHMASLAEKNTELEAKNAELQRALAKLRARWEKQTQALEQRSQQVKLLTAKTEQLEAANEELTVSNGVLQKVKQDMGVVLEQNSDLHKKADAYTVIRREFDRMKEIHRETLTAKLRCETQLQIVTKELALHMAAPAAGNADMMFMVHQLQESNRVVMAQQADLLQAEGYLTMFMRAYKAQDAPYLRKLVKELEPLMVKSK